MPSGVLSTILADGEPDLTIEQPPTFAKLDWDGFSAAYFPASRRHDLRAIAAYGVYRRADVIDGWSVTDASRSIAEEPISTRASAVASWEDEGGASS